MGRKILVIDDDLEILNVLDIILVEENFEPLLYPAGMDAPDVALLEPDLILLDVRIQGQQKMGTQLCVEYKAYPALANVPVLLFSAESDLVELANNSGADGYVSKPFDIHLLINKIKEFVP